MFSCEAFTVNTCQMNKLEFSVTDLKVMVLLICFVVSDSKSCLSCLNWPRSGKNTHFLALFWLVEGTLGIGWK